MTEHACARFQRVHESDRCYAKNEWLMGPDGEYLQRYWRPEHAARAARDFNENGLALAPVEYAKVGR